MFGQWFTNKCLAFVGDDGRALSESDAKKSNRFRRCGYAVNRHAKFCSRCGSPAPGGWWRCGSCNQWIGNESKTCPHCGKVQNVSARLFLADGVWLKGDDVFAQRFDLLDVQVLMKKGLSIQEGQCAVLLEGGAAVDVLPPGHYPASDLLDLQEYLKSGTPKSFIMVDIAEIPFPVMVDTIRTKEDMSVDLSCVVVIQFNHEKPVEFLANVMGNRAFITNDQVTAHLGYDDVAKFLITDIDIAVRDFCNTQTVDELLKNPKLRVDLENRIAAQLHRNLDASGLRFIRLKEVEFHGQIYDQLRAKSGHIEENRREIEFQLKADELANNFAKRQAMSEAEMQDYLEDLAQEKKIRHFLRNDEKARLLEIWKLDRAKSELAKNRELAGLEQEAVDTFEENDVLHSNKLKGLEQDGEIERRQKEHAVLIDQRIKEQNASLTYEQIEVQIQRMKVEAEQEATRGWVDIQLHKQQGLQRMELERASAFQGADAQALIAAIDDPLRAERVLRLAEEEIRSKMTPELLLAAAAARGVPEAAKALAEMSAEQKAVLEKSKEENKAVYEKMLEMSERMFNQATDSMAKQNAAQPTTTTQIIK